jgi:hypothetical protein
MLNSSGGTGAALHTAPGVMPWLFWHNTVTARHSNVGPRNSTAAHLLCQLSMLCCVCRLVPCLDSCCCAISGSVGCCCAALQLLQLRCCCVMRRLDSRAATDKHHPAYCASNYCFLDVLMHSKRKQPCVSAQPCL